MCDAAFLQLNVTKAKEILDENPLAPIHTIIKGQAVENVET